MEFTNEELTNIVLDLETKLGEMTEKALTLENDIVHLTARVDTMSTNKADIGDVVDKYERIKDLIREFAKIIKEDIKLKEELKNE